MKLLVNGQEQEIAAGTTLRQLLATLGLDPQRVAIELNRRLVRSTEYDRVLAEGDQVEIVTFVGGG